MGDCSAYKISRVVLFLFNVLFFAFGLAMLGIGIYAKVHSTKFDDYLTVIDQSNSTWENFGGLTIAAGVICAVLGFSGCIGALKENKGCVLFFVILVAFIFLLEVIGAGLAYGFEDKIKSKSRDGMYSTIQQYNNGSGTSVTKSWDNIQKDLSCCGVTQPEDWWLNPNYPNGTYPESCLCAKPTNCSSTAYEEPFSNGCYNTVVNDVTNNWRTWGGALIAFAVLQLIGFIAGIVFIRKVKNQGYYLA